MNGYELTERWFSFVSENSDKVDCKHTALYLYIVELFNKRQWVEVLGLPTDYTMSVLNIGSYKTYKKTFDELVQFGFIKQVEVSKNQYSSTKISLVSASVKNTKASPKHLPKQVQSTSSIIKLINIETIKLINIDLLTEILKDESNKKELVRLKKDLEKLLPEKPKTEPDDLFDKFWNLYDKKKGKDKTILQWGKLKTEEKEKAIEGVSFYQKYQPETKYRKDPERYLSNRVWEDEEIYKSKQLIQPQPTQGYSAGSMQSLDHLAHGN
jgi:hypothetical protein